jgi:hypothetical protein
VAEQEVEAALATLQQFAEHCKGGFAKYVQSVFDKLVTSTDLPPRPVAELLGAFPAAFPLDKPWVKGVPVVLADDVKEIMDQSVTLLIDTVQNAEDEETAAYALDAIGQIAKAFGVAVVPDEILERLCEVTQAVITDEQQNGDGEGEDGEGEDGEGEGEGEGDGEGEGEGEEGEDGEDDGHGHGHGHGGHGHSHGKGGHGHSHGGHGHSHGHGGGKKKGGDDKKGGADKKKDDGKGAEKKDDLASLFANVSLADRTAPPAHTAGLTLPHAPHCCTVVLPDRELYRRCPSADDSEVGP